MIDYKTKYGYIPNIHFTLEQHLANYAEFDDNARRLFESFHTIREKMILNLRPVIAMFPHYSEHSHEHSEHIISAIEHLLGKSRIERLSPSDTWMILVSAYMHDLGMIVQGKELQDDWGTYEFQAHIRQCMESSDNEIKNAAINVSSTENTDYNINWPVQVHRDVILIASEFYRRKHPGRALNLPHRSELKQMLNIVISGDGRVPPRIQDTIGKICLSHGISFSEMLNLLKPTDSVFGFVFHPRFVATLLCIGDLCDLDNGRFNKMAIETFGGLTKNNLIHYYKHESVTSFVIQKDDISLVSNIQNKNIKKDLKSHESSPIQNTTKDIQNFCDEVLLATQNWISWIEDIVKNIKLYWNELCIPEIETMSPSIDYEILIDGSATISSKRNMRFSFSNEKAYALIEGYNLYNNNFVFVRELLQNSIDALKIQLWNDILSGRWNHLLLGIENDGAIDYSKLQPFYFSDASVFDYYKVNIQVNHNETEQFATFIIEDNGIGISKSIVENKIVQTGTENVIDKIDYAMPEWLKPTSAFGIGLHSVFAVTDTLFAQTSTEMDKTIYNINMHSGKLDGYVFMSVAEQQNSRFCNCMHGTRMELSLDISNFSGVNECREDDDEPLSDRPESDFCRYIQKSIEKMIELSLFHITYKFNDENKIVCKKYQDHMYFGLLFKENRRNHLLSSVYNVHNYDFAISISGDILVLWDKNKAILVQYNLNSDTKTYEPNCDVRCKGITVEKTKLVSSGFGLLPQTIDYWGGNTKEILNISRDKLSKIQIENNKRIFCEMRCCRANIYHSLLKILLVDDYIITWHSDILNLITPWLSETLSERDRKQFLCDELSSMYGKYCKLSFDEDHLKLMAIRHGFCEILKTYTNIFKEMLNKLSNDKQIEYVLNFILHNGSEDDLDDISKVVDYIETVLSLYDNEEDSVYIYEAFCEIFQTEFAYVFINKSEHDLYEYKERHSLFGKSLNPFGEIYTSQSVGMLAHSLRKIRIRHIKLHEIELSEYHSNSLDIYLSISIPNIIFLIICAGIDISSEISSISTYLKFIPGYMNNNGFININNISDIFTKQLTIHDSDFTENVLNHLPFLRFLSCKSIDMDKDGKLILLFNHKYEEKGTLRYTKESLAKFLTIRRHMNYIPTPSGLENIAINKGGSFSISSKNYHEDLWFCNYNYMTYLWMNFDDICKTYSPRLRLGERIEDIVNELMPNSRHDKKPITNLLRFIYHNRVYNSDLSYEEAWQSIHDTYRKFIQMILNCVPIEDNSATEMKK